MVAFLATEGLDPDRVAAEMASPATDEKMNAAREFALRSGLRGTPTLIINGRYRVQGRTLRDSLRIADGLIAMARAVPRRTPRPSRPALYASPSTFQETADEPSCRLPPRPDACRPGAAAGRLPAAGAGGGRRRTGVASAGRARRGGRGRTRAR